MNVKEIRARLKDMTDAQAKAMAEENIERGHQLQGEMNILQEMLDAAIENQDAEIEDLKAYKAAGDKPAGIMSQLFDSREDFSAKFGVGFRAAVTLPAGPKVVDPELPLSAQPIQTFADSLAQSATSGAVSYFVKTGTTRAAAQWDGTSAKPEASHSWEEKVANLAWIAAHTPIPKTAVSDYAQVEGVIRNELLVDLKVAKGSEALSGNNSSGIVGVLNTAGIQTHTKQVDDNVYDSIRRMITKSRESGLVPNYVVVSPAVAEELDLLKATDGQYLRINAGGTVWGLKVIEDEGMSVTADMTTSEGVMVYAGNAATWYTKEQDNVEIGLVNDQFIKNAYTLLAEGRHALAVKRPESFVYMASALA